MLISTKGRYALRVLIDMAEHNGNGYIKLKDVAQRQEISEKYLESIVKELVRQNIVVGLRGKGGGHSMQRFTFCCTSYCMDILKGICYPITVCED